MEPVLFLKPTSSYAYPGEPLRLPRVRPMLGRAQHGLPKHGVHHEVELGDHRISCQGRRGRGERDGLRGEIRRGDRRD